MNCQTGPASIPIFVNEDRLLISGAVVGERQDFEGELSRTCPAAKTQRAIDGFSLVRQSCEVHKPTLDVRCEPDPPKRNYSLAVRVSVCAFVGSVWLSEVLDARQFFGQPSRELQRLLCSEAVLFGFGATGERTFYPAFRYCSAQFERRPTLFE